MATKSRRVRAAGVAAALLALLATPCAAQEKLVLWFNKGYYPAEDRALQGIIDRFEKKTQVKAELSFYAINEMVPKAVAALDTGSVPDVAFGWTYGMTTAGKWASEGKLEDLSAIAERARARFLPGTLETAVFTGPDGRKAHYGLPVYQFSIHTHYWRDMLEEAGFRDSDIPRGWRQYWDFWCHKVQPAYRERTGKRIHAIGLPMGVDGTDGMNGLHQFLLAHGVKVVDDSGKLTIQEPRNRAAAAAALKDYTNLYTAGCAPPSSTTWKDPDNNVAMHNRTTIMTFNTTISIPARWLDDSGNAALKPEERAQARKNYEALIATAPWPDKLDGTPMTYPTGAPMVVVFKGARNPSRAKEFVEFLIDDDNLIGYTEGSLGRWYPVTRSGADSAFWQADAHRRALAAQFSATTEVYPVIRNWKLALANNENVWARAMSRVVNDKWSPERATDEMIDRIVELVGR